VKHSIQFGWFNDSQNESFVAQRFVTNRPRSGIRANGIAHHAGICQKPQKPHLRRTADHRSTVRNRRELLHCRAVERMRRIGQREQKVNVAQIDHAVLRPRSS
jgi:hypothetical protein